MNLIIVESPTKAKTLGRFLGKDYKAEATMGHIKDLPKSPISVDIEHDFKPDYKIVEKQDKTIKMLKKAAKNAKVIYLASDPDREGEAIAAHVKDVLNGKQDQKFKRIVFHEITREAVEEAVKHPRKLDKNLVDAQIARRVLDRLVGYKLSPILWKKVRRGLSAGRVQTVAVRLIVEREREIEKFKPIEYWEIASELKGGKAGEQEKIIASLAKIDGKKAEVGDKKTADSIVSDLKKAKYKVADIKSRETKKRPYPPYTTSTMTQAAANVFGWSSKKTMSVAQSLYEHGFITYHRTDSLNLAQTAVARARSYIESNYGKEYLPESPRFYKTKSKSAQEAHEAIRPTDLKREYDLKQRFAEDGKKLYKLIWNRFVACQMADAIYDSTTIEITADKYLLRVSGAVVKFDGWRKIMPIRGKDDPVVLPKVEKNEVLDLIKVLAEQKFTLPPARYNEASLIKTLEKLGIGRPSTYAPTISTIRLRGYVEKEDGTFRPTPVGLTVTDFLVEHFDRVTDYGFTAQMEDSLDGVANGETKWVPVISEFWKGFDKKLKSVEKNAKRVKIPTEKLGKKCPECKEGELVIRSGRFGKFISCERFPECKYTEKFEQRIKMKCPTCKKGDVVIKKTKKGRKFFGCNRYPECDFASWTDPSKSNDKKSKK